MKKQIIGKANMAYLDVGQGYPVVMGHSFLWDADMWHPQLTMFRDNYRCIIPDLWSHGQSDPLPEAMYSIEKLAEDYWQFTQALGLKKFALLGLSVGGMWAAHIALAHPEAVSALVLMDTYLGAEPEATQKVYLGMIDEIERNNQFTPEFAYKVAPYFFAEDTNKNQPALVSDFIISLREAPGNHIAGRVALGKAIFTRSCLLNKLKQIKVPTLIVVGEEDIARPPHEALEMARYIPNAEIEIIPKAGHICTLEQPNYVNEVLKRFLENNLRTKVLLT
jgi:pimeloyl-ACP methyl ester carboxylesterase